MAASLLTIPPELRNQIYHQIFQDPVYKNHQSSPTVQISSLASFGKTNAYSSYSRPPCPDAALIRSCRQLHEETHLLYLRKTQFYLLGSVAEPAAFDKRTKDLSQRCRRAVRHIVLTARISHLRALNETWNSLPFGHDDFHLETLTLVPCRSEPFERSYAEVADLSQSHTLAYVLCETLKGLRNVNTIIVRNEGCFNDVIWRLAYRSMVYRLWRWCGRLCDLKFREYEDEQVFEIRCSSSRCDDEGLAHEWQQMSQDGWQDVLEELNRLMGKEGSRDGMENSPLAVDPAALH